MYSLALRYAFFQAQTLDCVSQMTFVVNVVPAGLARLFVFFIINILHTWLLRIFFFRLIRDITVGDPNKLRFCNSSYTSADTIWQCLKPSVKNRLWRTKEPKINFLPHSNVWSFEAVAWSHRVEEGCFLCCRLTCCLHLQGLAGRIGITSSQ